MPKKTLYRSNDRYIFGVCGGFAEYFDTDPTLLRVLYVVLTLFTGLFLGFLLYLVMALIIPSRPLWRERNQDDSRSQNL